MLLVAAVALVAASVQPATAMLQCDRVLTDGHMFDFGKLRGPHSVVTAERGQRSMDTNTTYTLDLCGPLRRKGNVPKGEECPNGSWACAITRSRADDGTLSIGRIITLAGSLKDHGGGHLDHKATRLRTADSHADAQKEGVRLVLHGGRYPLDVPAKERRNQRVIVELLCDAKREGTEGEWRVDEYVGGDDSKTTKTQETTETTGVTEKAESDNTTGPSEQQFVREGEPPALVFEGYQEDDADGEFGTLRLTWYTRYACENATGGGDAGSDKPEDYMRPGWGFFTWFVVVAFLATASYLIFGSWLNYNRYGARGWDLVPHGDTLRDVPYLLRDWVRRLINTLQGSGSRGGYSAL